MGGCRRDIPYGFMGGCKRYLVVLWVSVRGIFYFLWVGVRDIPYGCMGGCKRYTLWFYGWVEDIYLMVLWVGVRCIFYFYGWV